MSCPAFCGRRLRRYVRQRPTDPRAWGNRAENCIKVGLGLPGSFGIWGKEGHGHGCAMVVEGQQQGQRGGLACRAPQPCHLWQLLTM